MSNAAKFTEKGSIKINITCTPKSERDIILHLHISDTGIGISDNKISIIFDKFSRGSPANQNRYPGSGLGLYLVKKFVGMLDGDLEVKSELGKGTQFFVSLPCQLPLRVEDDSSPLAVNEVYEGDSFQLSADKVCKPTLNTRQPNQEKALDAKVLIVEDDQICAMVEKRVFTPLAKQVDLAETVEEAKEMLTNQKYDLIICDLGLPDGTGIDVINFGKKSKESKNMQSPFIAVTAHSDIKKRQEAKESGFVDFQTKPIAKETASLLCTTYITTNDGENSGAELPVVDLDLGKKRLSSDDDKDALMMIEELIKVLPADLNEFKEASDISLSLNVLHRIKGGLHYCGTPSLQACIEATYHDLNTNKDMTHKKEWIEKCNTEFEHLKAAYEEIKK